MSFAEIMFRIKQYSQKTIEKYLTIHKKRKTDFSIYPHDIFIFEKKDTLYPETVKIFGTDLNYTKEINWHFDLYASKEFPRLFSKDIEIQSEKYGSAKHVWEVNRLLFLPRICLNYKNSNDIKYLNQFISITKSWIKENPYLVGINWYSNIEVNIRLINWFLSWEILDANKLIEEIPEFNTFVYNEWLPVIYLHCLYSYKNPSRYSSANNHLIAEYTGLFIASSLWKFKEADKWNIYSKKGLEKEIKKQHSENGINKEEAAEYIQFITDFLLLANVVGEKTNNSFSDEYKSFLYKIFKYIYCFTDIKVNFPRYGDDDDGRVFFLDPDSFQNNFGSLLTSGAVIFKDPELKSKSTGFDIKNQILFGNEGEELYNSLKNIKYENSSCFFENEGHFILRNQKDNKETYIHFDAADLGYLSIAAHGHADALSFVLHLDGKEIFVDPGTYAYHTDKKWRQYFIGTLAHNTIRINKKNQALNGGPTLWLKHYNIFIDEFIKNEKFDKVVARHDGYVKSGIWHTREFLFDKLINRIIITDSIECKEDKELFIEFPLHMHPEIHPVKENNCIFIYDKNKNLKIKIINDPKFNSTLLKGNKSPIIGWYSKSFYKKEPAYVIYQTAEIRYSASFKTILDIT